MTIGHRDRESRMSWHRGSVPPHYDLSLELVRNVCQSIFMDGQVDVLCLQGHFGTELALYGLVVIFE